jgi:hypothetical protein
LWDYLNDRQSIEFLQLPPGGAEGGENLVFRISNPAFLAHFQVGLGIARQLAGF